jgi:hypothetical protein
MKSFRYRHPYRDSGLGAYYTRFSTGFNRLRGLRLSRAYGRVLSLHLERGKGLWPQNKKKDSSFGIGGAGVD